MLTSGVVNGRAHLGKDGTCKLPVSQHLAQSLAPAVPHHAHFGPAKVRLGGFHLETRLFGRPQKRLCKNFNDHTSRSHAKHATVCVSPFCTAHLTTQVAPLAPATFSFPPPVHRAENLHLSSPPHTRRRSQILRSVAQQSQFYPQLVVSVRRTMAGARAPSGSLRNHASTASKASKGGVFSTQPTAPKLKPGTFDGSDDSDSDSDSSSSSSSSDSDGSNKKKVKQTPLPKPKADVAKSTPAKSPTVNGLKASIKKEPPSKNIKKEATSSSDSSESGSGSESGSDSESDSASSSDEKPTKAPAKGGAVKKVTQSKPETKTAAADDSDSSSTSESADEKAKRPATKIDRKKEAPPKSKAKAVKQATPSESESESESSSPESSAESESESESEEDSEGSEDPEAQIQQQIKDDLKSAKATRAREPPSSSKAEATNKKIKTSQPSAPKDADGDIEMTDQSTGLTNGGAPTKV